MSSNKLKRRLARLKESLAYYQKWQYERPPQTHCSDEAWKSLAKNKNKSIRIKILVIEAELRQHAR